MLPLMREISMDINELMELLANSYNILAERAADMAYARRRLYDAYLMEGFTPEEALELCKIL